MTKTSQKWQGPWVFSVGPRRPERWVPRGLYSGHDSPGFRNSGYKKYYWETRGFGGRIEVWGKMGFLMIAEELEYTSV